MGFAVSIYLEEDYLDWYCRIKRMKNDHDGLVQGYFD